MIFRFSPAYIEYIHDEIVSKRMPGEEPINSSEYRNKELLESAASRPFQTAFGEEIHQTLFQKAAALFHSIVCNHCFTNGNKRTGLLALDMFLIANGYWLIVSNDDAYELATRTATHNRDGRVADLVLTEISTLIHESSITIGYLKHESLKKLPNIDRLHDRLVKEREAIITHPYNH